jgi:hypothetical protein
MIKKSVIILFLLASSVFSQNKNFTTNYRITHFAGGVQFGLNNNGIGGELTFLFSNFADNFPFSAKISAGVSRLDAGDPLLARKVFINNNTNGVPEETGTTYDFSLDFLYKMSFLGLRRNYLYAGPRFTKFDGNFNYIGGNEDFDVTSSQWGVGVGVENYFSIIPSIDLVLNFGYDYYFSETLYGHDTSYSPDGQDVNPREEYSFNDADKAINQPEHQLKAMMGFSFHF